MFNRRVLADNMRRLYIDATIALRHGGGLNSRMYASQRNHARATLLARCGYTQETMTILYNEAVRQAEQGAR